MYLIDTYISSPDQTVAGGAEKQLYLLATSLDPTCFKPIAVQLSPNNPLRLNHIIDGNLKIFHLPTTRFYGLKGLYNIGYLSRLVNRLNVDIIHTFFEKSEVMGWLAAKFSGIPIWITSRRDLGFKRKKIYDKIFRFSCKDCKRCVANCYAVKDQVAQQGNLANEKIEVIYNGLDLSMYQEPKNDQALRKELKMESGIPLVGMIANFNFEIKGHVYFLGAAKKILEKIANVKFVLVGDGPLRPRYEEVARELHLNNNVYFLGKKTDVRSIISNLDVSVLSSTSEGFSNVILESMASGKPVVATKVGGSPEMVVDGMTGYLVPPADPKVMAESIIHLLKDPDKALRMGEAGKKLVEEKFTIKAMVKNHENLYKSLLFETK